MVCKCISQKAAKISLWISLITLVVSVTVIILFPTIYNSILKKEISLGKGSLLTDIWMDIPLPILEKVYFFNITNKEEFLAGTEPLNVTEVGPYTYSGKWIKNNPFWNSNGTVSYRELRTYQFVPDKSCGSQEDEIYTLNGPLLIASNIAKNYNVAIRAALSTILSIVGEKVVIKKKIRELVYDGYEDFVIKYALYIKPDIPYKTGVFSWLYGKNATDDGLFTVFTGVDDNSKTNFINNWNGEEQLPFWKNRTCNMINGTNIETGPPINEYQGNYTFFQSIFCRSLTLNYTSDQVHYDIPCKRFMPTYSLFANKTENPDNYCYETEKERPSGLLDISSCQFGAPVFISFPHFYLADPSYLESVTGLNPDNEKHDSHMDVEPVTGLTIDIIIRFQINVELAEIEGIFQTYKPSKGILPVLWVELSLEIDEALADYMKRKVWAPKTISYSVLGVVAGISLILSIIFFLVLYLRKSDDDDDPLLDAIGDDDSPYKDEVSKENAMSSDKRYRKNQRIEDEEKCNNSPEYADLPFNTPSGSPP